MARARSIPLIDAARCTGCGRCIAACQLPLIAFETTAWRKTAVLQAPDQCSGCARCGLRCPVQAIAMVVASPVATSAGACLATP